MLEHTHYAIARGRVIILLGVAIALLHWFGEGMVPFYAFERGDFVDVLLPSNIHELWTRLLVVCIVVGFSVFAQLEVDGHPLIRNTRKITIFLASQRRFFYLVVQSVIGAKSGKVRPGGEDSQSVNLGLGGNRARAKNLWGTPTFAAVKLPDTAAFPRSQTGSRTHTECADAMSGQDNSGSEE